MFIEQILMKSQLANMFTFFNFFPVNVENQEIHSNMAGVVKLMSGRKKKCIHVCSHVNKLAHNH